MYRERSTGREKEGRQADYPACSWVVKHFVFRKFAKKKKEEEKRSPGYPDLDPSSSCLCLKNLSIQTFTWNWKNAYGEVSLLHLASRCHLLAVGGANAATHAKEICLSQGEEREQWERFQQGCHGFSKEARV